jgi:Homeodomain-like domain
MSPKQHSTLEDNQCKPTGKYLTVFQRKSLQKSLQQDLSGKQFQRIQIMLLADEGKTQAEICQELGCCQATARHWITMAKTNQAHHWQSNPIGRPNLVDEEYLQRLQQLVTACPQEINVRGLSSNCTETYGKAASVAEHSFQLLRNAKAHIFTYQKSNSANSSTVSASRNGRNAPSFNSSGKLN